MLKYKQMLEKKRKSNISELAAPVYSALIAAEYLVWQDR